ncbi:MAG: hypothetical protein ACRCVK_16315, partial [Aeromonas veronii]
MFGGVQVWPWNIWPGQDSASRGLCDDVCCCFITFSVKGFQQLFAVAEVVFTGGGGIGIFLYNAVLGG